MSTPSGSTVEQAETFAPPGEDIESAEAAYEFATLIRAKSGAQRQAAQGERYEVRPCRRVRGYTLKLPVLGWRLWYPTASRAAQFARRVAASYEAECFVYDAAGQVEPLGSLN